MKAPPQRECRISVRLKNVKKKWKSNEKPEQTRTKLEQNVNCCFSFVGQHFCRSRVSSTEQTSAESSFVCL